MVDQSRLSRSGDDLEFLQACVLQKVTVRALTGGVIETESVGGFMQAGIMSVINQAYSRLNSAKVKDGLARRRADGSLRRGLLPIWLPIHRRRSGATPRGVGTCAGTDVPGLMAFEMNSTVRAVKTPRLCQFWSKNWVRNPMLRGDRVRIRKTALSR